MKHLIIIGVGGFAREVYWHAQDSCGYGIEWDIKGFLDGDVRLEASEYEKLDKPLLGDVMEYAVQPDDVFICAIANSEARRKLTGVIRSKGGNFLNLISNQAIVQGNVQMGIGNIICPFTNINDHAVLGNFVLLNVGAGMGHDSRVDDYSSLMGGVKICGFTTAGKDTYWGTNAVALPHSKIEDGVQVGVGAVVFKRIKAGMKVFGNPAMPM